MNVTCGRTELREALRLVSSVTDPRNIKPILKDVHMRTVAEGLELSATDLEVGLKYLVRDVDVQSSGGIVVPADPVTGIVSESSVERLTLVVEDDKLRVATAQGTFNVMGMSEEEFPDIPDFPEEDAIEIEGAVIREMIDKTSFAVAIERQRYALNGVLLVAKTGAARIEMVATDGRRMARIWRKANVPSPITISSIVPVKAMQQLHKMIDDEEIVRINAQERQILMRGENGVLVAQLVEGRFPPYEEVIPTDLDKKLEIQAEEFGNSIRQAAVLSSRETHALVLKLSTEGCVIESSDPDAGDAHVELGGTFTGDPINIHFNADYLLDGVKAMSGESIRFEMKNDTRAAVMRGAGDYTYLVMPITRE